MFDKVIVKLKDYPDELSFILDENDYCNEENNMLTNLKGFVYIEDPYKPIELKINYYYFKNDNIYYVALDRDPFSVNNALKFLDFKNIESIDMNSILSTDTFKYISLSGKSSTSFTANFGDCFVKHKGLVSLVCLEDLENLLNK